MESELIQTVEEIIAKLKAERKENVDVQTDKHHIENMCTAGEIHYVEDRRILSVEYISLNNEKVQYNFYLENRIMFVDPVYNGKCEVKRKPITKKTRLENSDIVKLNSGILFFVRNPKLDEEDAVQHNEKNICIKNVNSNLKREEIPNDKEATCDIETQNNHNDFKFNKMSFVKEMESLPNQKPLQSYSGIYEMGDTTDTLETVTKLINQNSAQNDQITMDNRNINFYKFWLKKKVKNKIVDDFFITSRGMTRSKGPIVNV